MASDPPRPLPDQPTDPLGSLLGYQLRRASTAMLADLARSLGDLALKPTEASVLLLIAHNPGITQSEIGRILAIQRANMAPIAAMLSARRLIRRASGGGRSQELRASAAGETLAAQVEERIAAHEARFLPDLSATERQTLVALLRQVWTA